MRALAAAVLGLALLWSGYWFVGAREVTARTEAAFAAARAQGLVAERERLVLRGFPNRFDLTVDGLELFDPATGFGWDAPFVQVFALTYRPWHVIAAFPPDQTFQTPGGPMTLRAGKLQASLQVRPQASLPLDRTTLVGTDLALAADGFGSFGADDLRLASRDLDGDGRLHAVGLEVLGLVPDPALLSGFAGLPPRIDRLRLDADVGLEAPLDRAALSRRARPVMTGITLREALLVWGPVTARAQGRLVPDPTGRAEGSLELRLTNWRQLIPIAVEAGLVTAEVSGTWERMLAILAQQSGDPETLAVTLRFDAGRVSVGPLPLGPAPRLR